MAAILVGLVIVYFLGAYVIAPLAWERYAHGHPSFDDHPRLTQTGDHHPGDPLNVALVGTEDEIQTAMRLARWDAAAALGIRSGLRIAEDTLLSRPDEDAPVSSLYLFGRKEDLAFEQPVGGNPRRRHHVRFWRTEKTDQDGRPIWIGAASYDQRVGLSRTTGQITHHIAPDVDAERDRLFENLKAAERLADFYAVDDFHKTREGRNGGGDPWRTDGRLFVGTLRTDTAGDQTAP